MTTLSRNSSSSLLAAWAVLFMTLVFYWVFCFVCIMVVDAIYSFFSHDPLIYGLYWSSAGATLLALFFLVDIAKDLFSKDKGDDSRSVWKPLQALRAKFVRAMNFIGELGTLWFLIVLLSVALGKALQQGQRFWVAFLALMVAMLSYFLFYDIRQTQNDLRRSRAETRKIEYAYFNCLQPKIEEMRELLSSAYRSLRASSSKVASLRDIAVFLSGAVCTCEGRGHDDPHKEGCPTLKALEQIKSI